MATAVKQSAAGNPPAELSSFVGRGRELTEVKRLLSTARVITLTGPGGIGKSRRSLRVQERRDAHGIDDALLSHLRDRRLLLVLDNCEHLLDACRRLVTYAVSGCERVRILCTSRERLGVAGESVVALSALDVPANGEQWS